MCNRSEECVLYLHNEVDVVWFVMESIQEDLGVVP